MLWFSAFIVRLLSSALGASSVAGKSEGHGPVAFSTRPFCFEGDCCAKARLAMVLAFQAAW